MNKFYLTITIIACSITSLVTYYVMKEQTVKNTEINIVELNSDNSEFNEEANKTEVAQEVIREEGEGNGYNHNGEDQSSTDYGIENNQLNNWSYDIINDRLRGFLYTVSTISLTENVVSVWNEEPSRMKIILREKKHDYPTENNRMDMEIILKVNEYGQFNCIKELQHCMLNVRFDDRILRYPFNRSSDGITHTIFVASREHFRQELEKSKVMVIEAPFFKVGKKQFEFNVEGLDLNN